MKKSWLGNPIAMAILVAVLASPLLLGVGLLTGKVDLDDPRPAVAASSSASRPSAASSPLLTEPRVASLTATVAISELSVLGSVPPSNEPALFGAAQALVVPQGWTLTVLGRYHTALENGVSADFLVVENGQKALVFFRMLDGRLTTSVDDVAFATLPEIPFSPN